MFIHKKCKKIMKKIKLRSPIFNDSFKQIPPKKWIEFKENLRFFCFISPFFLLHNFVFRIKTNFYFEWIVYFFFFLLQTTRMISITMNRSKAQQRRTVWYNIRITTNNSSERCGNRYELVLIHSLNIYKHVPHCCWYYCCRQCYCCCCCCRSILQIQVRTTNVCSVYIPIKK